MKKSDGQLMYNWAKYLFPITRSISSPGNKETLNFLKNKITNLKIKNFKSGKLIYGWKIPKQWHVNEAYILENNKKILDFKKNNLHVLNFSKPIKKKLTYKKLAKNIFFLKNQPNAIPYVTSYYSKNWGFSMAYNQFKSLKKNSEFFVKIKSKFKSGNMHYGEVLIKGKSKKEILLSTNICHPSMGNNETSGIVVTARLCQWINRLKNRRYSYRIIFIPETIGSIAYINKNFATLKKNVFAGFVVVCVGVDCMPSFLPSKQGNTISDHAALISIKKNSKKFKRYSFLDRGSDERQFCSEKVNLPICSIMSKKYGDYKEYHTSLDNMNYISSKGLEKSFKIIKDAIQILENTKNVSNIIPIKKKLKKNNKIFKNKSIYKNIFKYPCEPKLSNYGLRKPISFKTNYKFDKLVLNILMLSDGENDLSKISKILNQKKSIIKKIANLLVKKKLLKRIYKK